MAEPEGFREFVLAETPGLLRRAELLCGDRQLAEDLVQETLARLFTRWGRIRADQNPSGYAHAVLTTTFLSRARKRSWQERPVAQVQPDRAEARDEAELRVSLAAALAVLSPPERAVVVWRYLDDLPVAAVAQRLGRSEAWVRTTAHRALAKLREDEHLDFADDAGLVDVAPTTRRQP